MASPYLAASDAPLLSNHGSQGPFDDMIIPQPLSPFSIDTYPATLPHPHAAAREPIAPIHQSSVDTSRQHWQDPPSRRESKSCCNPAPSTPDHPASQTHDPAMFSHEQFPTDSWQHRSNSATNLGSVPGAQLSPITTAQDFKFAQPSSPYEFPQTTAYHIPGNFATANHPVTKEEHDRLQEADVYSRQTVPLYANAGIAGVAAPSAETSCMSRDLSSTAHMCQCNNCECEGCPVHPFNRTMMAMYTEIRGHLLQSRPTSSYGDPQQISQMTGNFDAQSTLPFGHMEHGIPDGLVEGQQAVSPANFSIPQDQSSSGDLHSNQMLGTYPPSAAYMHYLVEFSPQSNCPAALEVTCHCQQGCFCEGCLVHTGHRLSFSNDVPGSG